MRAAAPKAVCGADTHGWCSAEPHSSDTAWGWAVPPLGALLLVEGREGGKERGVTLSEQ